MTEKKQRAAALAAASVLGLSLGMVALNAEADQVKQQTTNQIKGETKQIKGETTQIKGETSQIKIGDTQIKKTPINPNTNQLKFWNSGASNQGKLVGGPASNQGKLVSGDHKIGTGSNQIKWQGVSNQHKGQTPSPDLNPQPEPPMQAPPAGKHKPQ